MFLCLYVCMYVYKCVCVCCVLRAPDFIAEMCIGVYFTEVLEEGGARHERGELERCSGEVSVSRQQAQLHACMHNCLCDASP